MSCIDSEGMRRDFEKGLTVKEIAEHYLVTEDLVRNAIGMSGGKLKERIREISPWHYKENSNEHCDCQLEPMWQIFEEAYKEFPVDDMPNSTPDDEMLLRLIWLDIERLNWRLKWFGK